MSAGATSMSIDTLKYARRLKAAGVPAEQAEAQAEAINEAVQSGLATKADVAMLRADLVAMEARITNKTFYIIIAQTIAIGGLLLAALQLVPCP